MGQFLFFESLLPIIWVGFPLGTEPPPFFRQPPMSILPEPAFLLDPTPAPEIPLPNGWTELTLQAILHVIAIARIVILNAANWPSDRECDGLRLRVGNDRLRAEINLLKQELAIKGARIAHRLGESHWRCICGE